MIANSAPTENTDTCFADTAYPKVRKDFYRYSELFQQEKINRAHERALEVQKAINVLSGLSLVENSKQQMADFLLSTIPYARDEQKVTTDSLEYYKTVGPHIDALFKNEELRKGVRRSICHIIGLLHAPKAHDSDYYNRYFSSGHKTTYYTDGIKDGISLDFGELLTAFLFPQDQIKDETDLVSALGAQFTDPGYDMEVTPILLQAAKDGILDALKLENLFDRYLTKRLYDNGISTLGDLVQSFQKSESGNFTPTRTPHSHRAWGEDREEYQEECQDKQCQERESLRNFWKKSDLSKVTLNSLTQPRVIDVLYGYFYLKDRKPLPLSNYEKSIKDDK